MARSREKFFALIALGLATVVGCGRSGSPPASSAVNKSARSASIPAPHCGARSAYTDAVLGANGVVAYWRLGETRGTAACDSAGTISGAYQGGYSLGEVGLVRADADRSVRFDRGYVRFASTTALNPTKTVSLEAWVRPEASSAEQAVVRKNRQYLVRLANRSIVVRLWWADGTSTEVTSTPVVTRDRTQQIVLSYDGKKIRVFRNGLLLMSKAASKSIATSASPLYIGQSGGYDYFDGRIDEVAVYRTALSSDQVGVQYRAAANPLDAPTYLNAVGGASAIGLHWRSPGLGATAYNVYRAKADGSWPTSPLSTVPAAENAYVDTDAPPSAKYRVTAVGRDRRETRPSGSARATLNHTVLLAAGDIAGCDTSGDEKTAAILDRTSGQIQTLGDNVYEDGSIQQFRKCYDPTWGRHRWRTHAALGEHEFGTPNASGYFEYFGRSAGDPALGHYSYHQRGWHIVVLNPDCRSAGCAPRSAQERWLRTDLSNHATRCSVAVLYSPRWSSGSVHGSNASVQPLWRALVDGGVEVVLSAEDHHYERFSPMDVHGAEHKNGTRAFVVGTGGRSHYPFAKRLPTSEVRNNDTFGVLELTLRGASYSWKFLPEAGKTFTDAGSDTCH